MQKEVLFDAMTAAEVAERMAAMDSLARQHQEHQAVLNAIFLTVARSSGCAPTDEVRLNAARTGVLVGPPVSAGVEASPGMDEPGGSAKPENKKAANR